LRAALEAQPDGAGAPFGQTRRRADDATPRPAHLL